MDEQQFKALSDKIDTIIKLLALDAIEDKPLKDQILILSSFGFQPKQIAGLLDKTPNHIRVLLHGIRKVKSLEEASEENKTNQTQGESNA